MLAHIQELFHENQSFVEASEEQKNLLYCTALKLINEIGTEAHEFGELGRLMRGTRGTTIFEDGYVNMSMAVFPGSSDLLIQVGDITNAHMQVHYEKDVDTLILTEWYGEQKVALKEHISQQTAVLFLDAIRNFSQSE